MSFFERVKEVAKAALTPPPAEAGTPTQAPAYVTPTAYDVKPVEGWLLLHYGPNRKERRKLQAMLRRDTPVEVLQTKGSVSRIEYDKDKIREKLKTAPSNFPIRVAPPELLAIAKQPDPHKTPYIFEPEYWQFRNALAEVMRKAKDALDTQPETTETELVSAAPSLQLTPANA